MQPLTSTQQKLILFLHEYISTNGYPPSIYEIAEELHFASQAPVQYALAALENKGYIKREFGKPRTTQLVQDEILKQLGVNVLILGTIC